MDRDLAGPVRANELLAWTAMADACKAGCTVHHLRESGTSASLAQWKERFGARPVDHLEYRIESIPITRLDTALRTGVKRLRQLEELLSKSDVGLTKRELLTLTREKTKLDQALGGIKDMGGLPDMIFVIDTNKEDIAIQEAQRLNIPVAAIVDTNSDPKGITFVVPGNDDAGRAISLYCDLIARAAIDGISRAQGDHGITDTTWDRERDGR